MKKRVVFKICSIPIPTYLHRNSRKSHRKNQSSSSLRGRRLKRKGKGGLGARETRGAREEGGREGDACQETIVFVVFNIHQANVKILIGLSSNHVNHSLNTLIPIG